jgi:ribosomal protein L11 methyltransferase
VVVSRDRAEEARALLVELAPEGFEERELPDGVEFAIYGDPSAEERLLAAFGGGRGEDVEAGWEDRWRAFHRPVRAGGLWIGPPWEAPPVGEAAVVIDPGRAFGTGAHGTTRACVELLARAERGALLDVGCGSGVLAIAAARLGYGPILAVDVDPVAVEVTRANATANGVELEARVLDAAAGPLPLADLTVANIALEAVERLRPASPFVVTSGYFARDAPALPGYARADRVELDGWAADLHVRR